MLSPDLSAGYTGVKLCLNFVKINRSEKKWYNGICIFCIYYT